jgi:hypothetical protein
MHAIYIFNMTYSKVQNFGFHLVTKSPWPILLSFSLLNLAIGAVLSMQGFNQGSNVLSLGLIITIFGMGLWFRDVVTEGTDFQLKSFYNLKIAKSLSDQEIKKGIKFL